MGSVGIYLYYILLFKSFSIAPAGQANVVNYLWPVFIILFSVPVLKEKLSLRGLVAVLLSFFGAWFVLTEGQIFNFESEYVIGYIYAGIAALCYGLFSVFGKKFHYEKFTSMMVYYLSAVILIIPTTLLTSDVVIPQSLNTILGILLLGGISNSLAFVFWFKALASGDTQKTSNIIYVIPFLALVWTYLINGEPVKYVSLIGLCLIIIGILIQLKDGK